MVRWLTVFLVRLYPRGWRQRYERELLALIETSESTWRVAFEVAANVGLERWRQVAQCTLGRDVVDSSPPTAPVCVLTVAAVAYASWLAGRWLDPIVPDGGASIVLSQGLWLFVMLLGILARRPQGRLSLASRPLMTRWATAAVAASWCLLAASLEDQVLQHLMSTLLAAAVTLEWFWVAAPHLMFATTPKPTVPVSPLGLKPDGS